LIGFVGMGRMGLPMAANLVGAGVAVKGFDVSPQACAAAATAGVEVAGSLAAAVSGCDVVFTMLPDGARVLECYGLMLGHLEAGTLVVDCSTVGIVDGRAIHAAAAAAGFSSLDAPVSGGVEGAKAGTLTFMVGGTRTNLARVDPLLAAMGRATIYCGDHGAGQAAKVCNNMILGATMVAVSEAFVLGEAVGLSPQALYDVASVSSGSCFALLKNCPAPGPVPSSPANDGYKAGFTAELMLKDLRLAQAAAHDAGVATPVGGQAVAAYEQFSAQGGGGLDFSGVITSIRGTAIRETAGER
jgi:3-hydroxyisobutyrate dehydrogenase